MSDSVQTFCLRLARACLGGLAVLCLAWPVAAQVDLAVPAPGMREVVPDTTPTNPAKRSLKLSDFLSDDEMGMLFEYLRDAFFASLRGNEEEAVMAPELAFKLSILRQRLIREGDAAARQVMLALQKEVERALAEYQRKKSQQEGEVVPPAAPALPQAAVPPFLIAPGRQ